MSDETGQENQTENFAADKDMARKPFMPRPLAPRHRRLGPFPIWLLRVATIMLFIILDFSIWWFIIDSSSFIKVFAITVLSGVIGISLFWVFIFRRKPKPRAKQQ